MNENGNTALQIIAEDETCVAYSIPASHPKWRFETDRRNSTAIYTEPLVNIPDFKYNVGTYDTVRSSHRRRQGWNMCPKMATLFMTVASKDKRVQINRLSANSRQTLTRQRGNTSETKTNHTAALQELVT